MMSLSIDRLILLCFVLTSGIGAFAWELSSDHFDCGGNRILYRFTARNGSSVVHFLSAADIHVRPPAIIVLHSNFLESAVSVNCTEYSKNDTFPNSVKVTAVTASYGILLYELCDYIDIEDRAQLPPDTDCHQYFGSNLDWEVKEVGYDSTNEVSIAFRGTTYNDSRDMFLPDGSVEVKFTVFAKDTKPYDAFYYEVAGGLCVEVRIVIDRLLAKNPRTRVAPVLLVFSNQSMEDTDDFVQISGYPIGISDGPLGRLESQYVLLDQRVKAGRMGHDTPPAFIQSIPVSVTNPNPEEAAHSLRFANLARRTIVKHSSTAKKYAHSLVYAYYGARFNQIHQGSHEGYVGAREQFVNLGTPKDGFYVATNYSAWTLLLHLGTPVIQAEANSRAVVATLITVGLLLAAGSTGLAYHYRRRRLARQLIHPIQPGFGESHATTVRERMAPVEPFQRRKMFSMFQSRRSGETSTEPLLHPEPPPSYDSVNNTEL